MHLPYLYLFQKKPPLHLNSKSILFFLEDFFFSLCLFSLYFLEESNDPIRRILDDNCLAPVVLDHIRLCIKVFSLCKCTNNKSYFIESQKKKKLYTKPSENGGHR